MSETTILTFTDKAIQYLLSMLQKKTNKCGVRIAVKKAGCSGLKYVLDYVEDINSDDEILNIESNLIIYVDKAAVPYIFGSTVDYVKDGLNGKIIFINPNESSSCGCGESFYV